MNKFFRSRRVLEYHFTLYVEIYELIRRISHPIYVKYYSQKDSSEDKITIKRRMTSFTDWGESNWVNFSFQFEPSILSSFQINDFSF